MLKKASTVAVGALAALGLLVVLVSATPLVTWWATRLAGPWYQPRGEVLIVLGGSMLDRGMIGQTSYWRSVYAVRVYREGEFRRVVVSGGPPDNPASEAMKRFLVCEGIPAARVDTEAQSVSTRENALALHRMLGGVAGRKVLLTSDYHMYRASRALAKAGLPVITVPFPDAIKQAARWTGRWSAFLELCVETGKIAYYYARGWI
jgi:uncharacterized SAM-binding protein YcdF (DUF218 family)